MKNKFLLIALIITSIAATAGLVNIATNYTSQQIDNWTFWAPDSSQKVHISSTGPGLIINSQSLPDTATYAFYDSVKVADTLKVSSHFSFRYKVDITPGAVDTLKIFLSSKDSIVVYPGGLYASDYLDPNTRPQVIVKPFTSGVTANYNQVSQGR